MLTTTITLTTLIPAATLAFASHALAPTMMLLHAAPVSRGPAAQSPAAQSAAAPRAAAHGSAAAQGDATSTASPAPMPADAPGSAGHIIDQPMHEMNGDSAKAEASTHGAGGAGQGQMACASGGVSSLEGAEFGIYGAGIGGDALANNTVGGPVGATKWYLRFRAEQSSPLTSVTFSFLSADYPGYGGGTGGMWRLTLHADDGSDDHLPAGLPLASRVVSPSATSDAARTVTFPQPYMTTAGALYHLVFENIDPDPKVNYFSTNNWLRLSFTEGGPLNPLFQETDWGSGFLHAGVWVPRKARAPIAQISYANGASQGMSYGEASYKCSPDPESCVTASLIGRIDHGTHRVRERFTVSGGDRTILGVGVRLLREAETSGDLVISLRNALDEELASAMIPASEVAVGPAPTFSASPSNDDLGQNARWVTAAFSEMVTLIHGESYSLEISSAGGTYWAWVMRRLTHEYGYSPATAFSDGWAEYTTDGVTWLPLGRVPKQCDLQFYLSTVTLPESNEGDGGIAGEEDPQVPASPFSLVNPARPRP